VALIINYKGKYMELNDISKIINDESRVKFYKVNDMIYFLVDDDSLYYLANTSKIVYNSMTHIDSILKYKHNVIPIDNAIHKIVYSGELMECKKKIIDYLYVYRFSYKWLK